MKNSKSFYLYFLLLDHHGKRIIGGSQFLQHFPYTVSIGLYDAKQLLFAHLMNGAVLDAKTIITTRPDRMDYDVLAGKYLVDTPPRRDQIYKVAEIITFTPNFTNIDNGNTTDSYEDNYPVVFDPVSDIAILKLERPLNLGGLIRPVCLPSAGYVPSKSCFIYGWGKVDKSNYKSVACMLTYYPQPFFP